MYFAIDVIHESDVNGIHFLPLMAWGILNIDPLVGGFFERGQFCQGVGLYVLLSGDLDDDYFVEISHDAFDKIKILYHPFFLCFVFAVAL